MRFKDIREFKVDELLLDEENYRFKAASNQKVCIEKIYLSNPQYFKNLITSVAEDDLGEPLLVYQHDGDNIVLDGNRRLAVLKVLADPKKYAPSATIKEHAEDMLKKNKVVLTGIQAQVSSDKSLVYRTVYERHSAGQGKSRIGWSAYGAARFKYDEKLEESKEWYAIALLLETEKRYPQWTGFLDSTEYSHEVFRRVMRSALDKGVISSSIFSDRDQRIKKGADKKLLKDAVDKANAFLEAMKSKKLSLSRSGGYADKAAVDAYVEGFSRSSDNARAQSPSSKNGATSSAATSAPSSTNGSRASGSNGNAAGTSGTTNSSSKGSSGYGIDRSQAVEEKLAELGSEKLIGLYNSLCTVSLVQHPQLLYVGAWSFFETISMLMGRPETTPFIGYLNSQINNLSLGYSRTVKKDYQNTLEDIDKKGNANKHSGTYHSTSAYQLRADFATLEPFILAVLDILIAKKRKP